MTVRARRACACAVGSVVEAKGEFPSVFDVRRHGVRRNRDGKVRSIDTGLAESCVQKVKSMYRSPEYKSIPGLPELCGSWQVPRHVWERRFRAA